MFPVQVKMLKFNMRDFMELGADWNKTLLKVRIGEKEHIMVTK